MLTKEAMREMLAKVAEERGWPNEARNLREDSVFCGQIVIGNVYEAMRRAYLVAIEDAFNAVETEDARENIRAIQTSKK